MHINPPNHGEKKVKVDASCKHKTNGLCAWETQARSYHFGVHIHAWERLYYITHFEEHNIKEFFSKLFVKIIKKDVFCCCVLQADGCKINFWAVTF